MNVKIGKEYIWEMSHRLPFHEGLCRNIHGHSYKMRVEIEGLKDENGMLLDYYMLDKIVLPIVKEFDHTFLCDDKDDVMLGFLKSNNFRHLVIPYHTTSENIAAYLMNLMIQGLKQFQNIKRVKIKFFETDDAYSEVEKDI